MLIKLNPQVRYQLTIIRKSFVVRFSSSILRSKLSPRLALQNSKQSSYYNIYVTGLQKFPNVQNRTLIEI